MATEYLTLSLPRSLSQEPPTILGRKRPLPRSLWPRSTMNMRIEASVPCKSCRYCTRRRRWLIDDRNETRSKVPQIAAYCGTPRAEQKPTQWPLHDHQSTRSCTGFAGEIFPNEARRGAFPIHTVIASACALRLCATPRMPPVLRATVSTRKIRVDGSA